jgi:uncharacterized membrane protein
LIASAHRRIDAAERGFVVHVGLAAGVLRALILALCAFVFALVLKLGHHIFVRLVEEGYQPMDFRSRFAA